MKVWLPALRVGTGTDVFTLRLADELRARGVDAEIGWFPAGMELAPRLMAMRRPPRRTDLIHGNGWTVAPFLGRGIPVVTTVHHLVHDPAFSAYRSPAQALYHRWHLLPRDARAIHEAAAVTAVSSYVAGTVRELFGRQDVQTIGNWVDTGRYCPAPDPEPVPGGPLRLLWVGNPSRRKGADLLPVLAARLGDTVQLRCVGGLRGDRTRLAGSAAIEWLGRLDEPQLIAEYRACDALLSLSRYEGFGYTALEAMACAKPVVAFAAGGLVDVVDNGVTGLLSPVDDLDGLTAHILRLASDVGLRRRLGDAALESARARRDSAAAYVQLYRAVLSGRGRT
jgi:starch synthase